jgi:lycopene beta-cyclase
MIHSRRFSDKKILIVDKEEKGKNDRTWCFWEMEPGLFESIVHKQWEQLWFHGQNFSRLLDLPSYHYKLIRGIDFYSHCFDLIGKQPNITVRLGDVGEIKNENGEPVLTMGNERISATYIFSSILFEKPRLSKKEYYLLQHFKGWFLQAEKPCFDPAKATLMDFRVSQEERTSFVYIMPFSETEALIEYTLFSEKLLEPKQYDEGLTAYIQKFLETGLYKIKEEEFGIIPMTNHRFPANDGNIINIGTAGGQTKASSGYTFRFIQKHSASIVRRLISGKSPVIKPGKRKFHFYDSVLLHIIQGKKLSGERIFSALFKKNKPQQLLRFLDNESSLGDDLKIISSLPTLPFLKAALKQV